jgi:hypothetical protein
MGWWFCYGKKNQNVAWRCDLAEMGRSGAAPLLIMTVSHVGSLRLPEGGDSHRMTALETIQ